MVLLLVLAGGWLGTSLLALLVRRVATNRDGRPWAWVRLIGGVLEVAGGPLVLATFVWAGVVTPDLLAGVDPRGNVIERTIAWARGHVGAFGVRLINLAAGTFLLVDHWREWVQDGRLTVDEWRRIAARDYAGVATRRQRTMDRYGV
jgi:hypothetical protein